MKLKTSFSNLMPLKKNITRFLPLGLVYLVGMVLVMMDQFGYATDGANASALPEVISSFGVVNLIYAAVCAQLLFGDLYNTKMCYSLHALPLRREGWLLSHLGAGLVFSLVPNFVGCLCIMSQTGSFGYLTMYVFLAMELQFLFFFGLAMVSALLTGNRFAMLLVYAGFNFAALLLYWVINTIYLPSLTGVVLNGENFYRLTPVVQLFSFDYMEFTDERVYDVNGGFTGIVYHFEGMGDGWGYLAILGGLGLVLMGLAVLLYRWRHLESAGNFVAFDKMKHPMLVVMTLCLGGAMAFMGDMVFGYSMAPWLIVGIVLGWFGGLMLLERRVKVFRKGSVIGFAVLAAVLICSFMFIEADVFGIVRWTPAAEQVQSVTLSNYYNKGIIENDYYWGNRMSVTLETEAEIADIIQAHEDILDRLDEPTEIWNEDGGYYQKNVHRVVLSYKLKNGRTVVRSYSAPASGKNYEIVSKYFYTPENILGFSDWKEGLETVCYLNLGGNEIPVSHWGPVLEALVLDCQAGKVVSADKSGNVIGYVWYQAEHFSRDLYILEGATHIQAALSEPEIVLGYTDWDVLVQGVYYMSVEGMEVGGAHFEGLLEALKADCEAGHISLLEDAKESLYYLEFAENSYRVLSISEEAENTVAYIREHILE